jgi:hypothetical protein
LRVGAFLCQTESAKPRHIGLTGKLLRLVVPHGLRLVVLAFSFHGGGPLMIAGHGSNSSSSASP